RGPMAGLDDQAKVEATGGSFTSGDAKKLAGLSYRQLNDWDSRGAVPGGREGENGWRRFSPRDLFALMVGSEIRSRFGVPVESLRWVMQCMVQNDGRDHFRAAVELMRLGLAVFLLTDFKATFVMDSDLEFEEMFQLGYFRTEFPHGYV